MTRAVDSTMSDDTFDDKVRDILGVSSSATVHAWNTYVEQHIEPSRLVKLVFNLAEVDHRERLHLDTCEKCLKRYYDFANCCEKQYSDSRTLASGQKELWDASHHAHAGQFFESKESGLQNGNVPALIRDHLQIDGPVVFPNNEVATTSWQFGRLLQLGGDDEAVQAIVDLIADKAGNVLRSRLNTRGVTLVCFGRAMHLCGVRLAAVLREYGIKDPHVILAHDYYSPTLVCDSKEIAKADVIVLVDVVHSGELLKRLITSCLRCCPLRVRGLALIDQSGEQLQTVEWFSLWREPREERIPLNTYVQVAPSVEQKCLRRFDPNDECAIEVKPFAPQACSTNNNLDTPRQIDAKLLACIHDTGALKRDYRIGNKLYPYVVNVLDLLKSPASQQYIVEQARERLSDLLGQRVCLAYHAGRTRRAGRIANILGEYLSLPVVPIGSNGSSFALSDSQFRRLACYDGVIIVDAAIRTGDTIAAITQAIDDKWLRKHTRFIAFCILDALSGRTRCSLAQELAVDIRSLFSLPLAPPTEQVRHWTVNQKAIIRERLLSAGEFESVRRVLGNYCDPPPARRPKASPPRSIEETSGLVNKAVSQVRTEYAVTSISEACRSNRPNLIRHLPLDEAVHDQRVQALLMGVVFNSMTPSFKESAVFALAAARKFEWMNLDWLRCNRSFFTAKSECWKSVAVVECQMKLEERKSELARFRDALATYRKLSVGGGNVKIPCEQSQIKLFDEYEATVSTANASSARLMERIDALIEVAS